MRFIFTILFFSISLLTFGQNLTDIFVRINNEPLDSLPKYVIKMNETEYHLDTIPDSIKPKWIEKIEVLKSIKEKYIYGNRNGIILIYPKKRYFRNISMLLETFPDAQKQIDTTPSYEIINHVKARISHPVKSEILLEKIDELIAIRDSLTESNNSNKMKSFWLYFSQKDDGCFVTILAQPLDIYDKDEMDGFFKYKERYISVYDSKIECGTDFIDTKQLQTGKIPDFLNYWSDIDNNNNSFPPHKCYGLEYRIVNKDKLELISQGYHLGRPQPEHRIPQKPEKY